MQVWADRHDGLIENLLDLQAEIAARIAASITSEIEWSEVRGAHRHDATNATAYDLALRAGAKLLTVRRDTGGDYRVFNAPNGGLELALSGLTISNGRAADIGGGLVSLSRASMARLAFAGNYAGLLYQ